jgi:hypothetical protein
MSYGGSKWGRGHVDFSIRECVMHAYLSDWVTGTGWYAIQDYASGETKSENIPIQMYIDNTTVQIFWENGTYGTNRQSIFTLPRELTMGDASTITCYREQSGGDWLVRCFQDGVQCTVSSVSGMTNNTTYTIGTDADGANKTDAGRMRLGHPSGCGADAAVCVIHPAVFPSGAGDQLIDHNAIRVMMPHLGAL